MDGTDDYTLWNDSIQNGDVSSEFEKNDDAECEDGQTMKMGKVTVIGKDRWNLACFVY